MFQNFPGHFLKRPFHIFRHFSAFAQLLKTTLDPFVLQRQRPQRRCIPFVLHKPSLVRKNTKRNEEQKSLGKNFVRSVAMGLQHGDTVRGKLSSRKLDTNRHKIRRGRTAPQVQHRRFGKSDRQNVAFKLPCVQRYLRTVLEHPDRHSGIRGALTLDMILPHTIPAPQAKTGICNPLLLLTILTIDKVLIGVPLHPLTAGVGFVKNLVDHRNDKSGTVIQKGSEDIIVRRVDDRRHPLLPPAPVCLPLY